MMFVLAKRWGRIYHPMRPRTPQHHRRRGLCGEGWTPEYLTFSESDAQKRGMRVCKNCERRR